MHVYHYITLRGYYCRLPDAWCKVKFSILFPALVQTCSGTTVTWIMLRPLSTNVVVRRSLESCYDLFRQSALSSFRRYNSPCSNVSTVTHSELKRTYWARTLHSYLGIFLLLAACKCTLSGISRIWTFIQQQRQRFPHLSSLMMNGISWNLVSNFR